MVSPADIAHGLQKGKCIGSNKYMACCPAHEDKSPSLHITLGRDNNILVHCFSGCSQLAVVESLKSLGLWPEKEREQKNDKPKYNPANDNRNLESFDRAVLIVAIAELDKEKGLEFSENDIDAIHKARTVISRYKQYFYWENLSGFEWRMLTNRRLDIALEKVSKFK